MKRGLFFVSVLLFLLVICSGVYAQTVSYDDVIKKTAWAIEGKLDGGAPIAILNFDSSSARFTNRVINDLTEILVNDGIKVVDRQNLEIIMAEQNFQMSNWEYIDERSLVSIGKIQGWQSIVLGLGENMADYYHMQFRMINMESAEIQTQISQKVKYDAAMRRLLAGTDSNAIGNTHFVIGGRLGAGFEINTADEDMVGSGYSPKEKSNIAFNAVLYGGYRLNLLWSVQTELNFMINNGQEISGQGYTVTVAYSTLDIPLLLRWDFMQSPLKAGILLGPYVSLPIGKLNLSQRERGSALDMRGISWGISGGFVFGYKLGPGFLVADVRFLHDFVSLTVREDFGDGMQDAKIGIRRSINISLGYEFSL
jgi:hypothetical protein